MRQYTRAGIAWQIEEVRSPSWDLRQWRVRVLRESVEPMEVFVGATTRNLVSIPSDHHLDRDEPEAEIQAGATYTEAEIQAGVLDAVVRVLGRDVANWPARLDPIDATCEDFYRAAGGVM